MTTTYYSVTTDSFSTFINDFIISGEDTLDLTGWSVKLGTGELQPTHATTDLINPIYDKTTTGYVGFTASDYAGGGKLISISVPTSVLQGNVITEIGLYDSDDVLMCAAATYLDLTITSGQGLQPSFVEQLVLKDVPSNVTVVYESWENYQLRHEKNQANGYAGLDANAKVPLANLPTNLSDFNDDLGSNPVHTHSQYLTSHQDISNLANNDLSNLSATGVNNIIQYTHELDFDNISIISTTSTDGTWALYTSVDDGILVVDAAGTGDIIAEISDNVVNYSLSAVRSYWGTSHNESVFFPMVKGMTLRYRNRGTAVYTIFIPFKKSI